jgi:hypothetical protein
MAFGLYFIFDYRKAEHAVSDITELFNLYGIFYKIQNNYEQSYKLVKLRLYNIRFHICIKVETFCEEMVEDVRIMLFLNRLIP